MTFDQALKLSEGENNRNILKKRIQTEKKHTKILCMFIVFKEQQIAYLAGAETEKSVKG